MTKVFFLKRRILVVEDNSFIRSTAVKVLRTIGVRHITEAIDGTSALRKIAAQSQHLIVCDIEMQPMNDLEFLKILRASTPADQPVVPVKFLTSHAESEIVLQAKKLGVDPFLVKPISQVKLKERLDWIIERRGDICGIAGQA
ncbi:MAG: response regulator [Alphaproteobacteria bacterium]|nr:response regulator [Alphaproteobacteria bacterium]